MGEIKNYGKSNRTKLLNLSRQTKGADYNLILLRFVQERFSRTRGQVPVSPTNTNFTN